MIVVSVSVVFGRTSTPCVSSTTIITMVVVSCISYVAM